MWEVTKLVVLCLSFSLGPADVHDDDADADVHVVDAHIHGPDVQTHLGSSEEELDEKYYTALSSPDEKFYTATSSPSYDSSSPFYDSSSWEWDSDWDNRTVFGSPPPSLSTTPTHSPPQSPPPSPPPRSPLELPMFLHHILPSDHPILQDPPLPPRSPDELRMFLHQFLPNDHPFLLDPPPPLPPHHFLPPLFHQPPSPPRHNVLVVAPQYLAPLEAVESLPTRLYSVAQTQDEIQEDDASSKCTICQSDYADGDRLRTLDCSHEFHQECVDHWLTSFNGKCPLCRSMVPTPHLPAPPEDVQATPPTILSFVLSRLFAWLSHLYVFVSCFFIWFFTKDEDMPELELITESASEDSDSDLPSPGEEEYDCDSEPSDVEESTAPTSVFSHQRLLPPLRVAYFGL